MQGGEGRGAHAYVRQEAGGACYRARLQSNLAYTISVYDIREQFHIYFSVVCI